MLELVNLTNCTEDLALINNSADCLQEFLRYRNLDGLEMMFCEPWEDRIHKKEWIHGVHLKFWPCWLDFWRGDEKLLLEEFSSQENIKAYYGSLSVEAWLRVFRENISLAKQAGAKYIVFHVSHTCTSELFAWRFRASAREVIEATIQLINTLVPEIPPDMELLFENLWWPGLTLQDKELTALLLENIKHSKVGIMLDTGHLLNTNQSLRTEQEGIKYILETVAALGEHRKYIKGIHLHCSLSGEYITTSKCRGQQPYSMAELMEHILKIDEHKPFTTPEVHRIIDYIQPEYLVHEFLYSSLNEWQQKIICQQKSIRGGY